MLLWRNLEHSHILPFIGVDRTVFQRAPCIVLPWMRNGNAKQYLKRRVELEGLSGPAYLAVITRIVRTLSVLTAVPSNLLTLLAL